MFEFSDQLGSLDYIRQSARWISITLEAAFVEAFTISVSGIDPSRGCV